MPHRTPERRPHVPALSRRGLLTGAAGGGAPATTSPDRAAAAEDQPDRAAAAEAQPDNAAAVEAQPKALRPAKLRPGDKVRLVSPASSSPASAVTRGVEILRGWGLEVEYAEHALTRYGYLAAPDADRLADLNAAFADPAVRGVLCTRGGYGVQRLVDGIDPDAVRGDPKVLLGFSDITGIQMWLWRNTGLATLHGPMISWNDSRTGPESAEALRQALMTTDQIVLRRDPGETGASVAVPGQASGVVLGGNVSLLSQAVGAHGFPDLRGAILVLEDVDEAPYRLDRMLTQLRRSGALDGVAGIALGQFTDCVGPPDTWTVDEMLHDRLTDLGVPILSGLPIGHGDGQLTVPFGVRGTIDTEAGTLTTEPAVR